MSDKLNKPWKDPVWSKLIAEAIKAIFAITIGGVIIASVKTWWDKTDFRTTISEFSATRIKLWIALATFFVFATVVYVFIKLKFSRKSNPLFISSHLNKYFGVYEVFHFAPHTTGNPKLTKSFLSISPHSTQYVHSLFECEEGELSQLDGHIFMNLKNNEQQNAPYYFIIKSTNDNKIEYLGGICLGIGQNQNCHPIAAKVALKRRDDINDFSITKYKTKCTIEELPNEKAHVEPYLSILREFLWNKCGDKDLLF